MPKYMGGLGFRDTHLFNLAMVAKQAWRLIQDTESLSARLLKAVYYPSCEVLDAELGNHPSQIWRAIVQGKEVLKQGLVRRIGDGRTTSIWNDNWIPRDFMLRTVHPRSTNPPELVADLIVSMERCWNRGKVLEHLQPIDAREILGIPLSTIPTDDCWAWQYERNGHFSVRSCYRMLKETKRRKEEWLEGTGGNSDSNAKKQQWCSLWGTKVPAKLKNFLWRLAHNSIPTEGVRFQRHMSESSLCKICNGAEDNWKHALIDCPMAKCVWAMADEELVEYMITIQTGDARLWLGELQRTTNEDQFVKAIVTLWSIWWARRKAIHEEQFHSPHSTLCFINKYIADLALLPKKQHVKHGVPKSTTSMQKWRRPAEGWAKMNVDAALSRNGERGALAVVSRDHSGLFLGASALVCENVTDPEILEALACSEGLSLALDLNLQKVQISTDCAATVKHIGEAYLGPSKVIMEEIKMKKNMFQTMEIIHEKRECNFEAHVLAKAATSLPCGRHLWLTGTPEIICIPMTVNLQ